MSNITIEGIDRLMMKLDDLGDLSGVKSGVQQGCAVVERAAKQKAPKDSGALRRSIESKVESGGNKVIGTVFSPLEYAAYCEYGTGLFAEKGGRRNVPWRYENDDGDWYTTSGQHPQPFLRPALRESEGKVIKKIKEGIKSK